jgi:hypothetical protein
LRSRRVHLIEIVVVLLWSLWNAQWFSVTEMTVKHHIFLKIMLTVIF